MVTWCNAVQGVCRTCPVRRRMHTCCLPSCKCKTSSIPTGHHPIPPSLLVPSSAHVVSLVIQSCTSNCTLIFSTVLADAATLCSSPQLCARHATFNPLCASCWYSAAICTCWVARQLHTASYSFIQLHTPDCVWGHLLSRVGHD